MRFSSSFGILIFANNLTYLNVSQGGEQFSLSLFLLKSRMCVELGKISQEPTANSIERHECVRARGQRSAARGVDATPATVEASPSRLVARMQCNKGVGRAFRSLCRARLGARAQHRGREWARRTQRPQPRYSRSAVARCGRTTPRRGRLAPRSVSAH